MNNVIQLIPLIELTTGDLHPHLEFQEDNLDNLINFIKKYGIIEPLLVRPKDNKFEIILGNRRYNAAKQLGMDKIPVIIVNVNDELALNMIITDNIQRKELTAKEEAKLYEKALTYPNINIEQLSINLGIPIDRINYKLELIKKESLKPTNDNNMNQSQYLNENNSVNNDIINLSELNKEEKERDDYNMNNNQFIDNNVNNNINQEVAGQENQAPAFGGRFFPSLEDQPTNMDMGAGINTNQEGFANNLNNGPLIDLTDTAPEAPVVEPQASVVPPVVASMDNMGQQVNPVPTPEMPAEVQGVPPVSPEQVAVPQMETPMPTPSIDIPNISDLNINPAMNIETPMPEASEPPIYNTINQTTPGMEIPNLGVNPAPINNNSINLDNIPDLTATEMPAPESIPMPQAPEIPQEAPVASGKDIVPVVNMIKNLAISIESLGYKLNITEDDNNESYKINIEVEK